MISKKLVSPVRLAVLVALLGAAQKAYGYEACSEYPVPMRSPGDRVRFIAFGDSGSGFPEQYRLAEQMEAARKKTGFRFAVMLGDNIYPRGDVALAAERFEKPYAELLEAGVKFYPVFGNHDLRTNDGRDEMAYFRMPDHWYSFKAGDAEFFMLDSNWSHMTLPNLAWLEKALWTSSARWKIVALHHPVYSAAGHRSSRWRRLFLEPILMANRASLVLSGHDHDYERIIPQKGTYYFVSGGAGGKIRPVRDSHEIDAVATAIPHFILFELGKEEGQFQAINSCGGVFDYGSLKPH
ncbi:MAG: metallophosphoesterase [Deltaproteobacteria bacterium]|nr:metallophosphoesterase [Deltaproteobacteria bacterium]